MNMNFTNPANTAPSAQSLHSGKDLDEACNHNNDAYCDEALYAAWINPPSADSASQGRRIPAVWALALPA